MCLKIAVVSAAALTWIDGCNASGNITYIPVLEYWLCGFGQQPGLLCSLDAVLISSRINVVFAILSFLQFVRCDDIHTYIK